LSDLLQLFPVSAADNEPRTFLDGHESCEPVR
jgi:hypothetical protein